MKDELFIRGEVPMTKEEIRILTLAKAQLKPNDVIVDIGAGTGSISIEAAQKVRQVFAIEKNPTAVELIEQNAEKFGIENIIIINAEAPNGLEGISKIDAAIIGGSGNNLLKILEVVDRKLKKGGRIILNCITIQTISTALEYFKSRNVYRYEAIQVQINRLHQVGRYDMAQALNPIYILTAELTNPSDSRV